MAAKKSDNNENKKFIMHSKFEPAGDQPAAIKKLVKGVRDGKKLQTVHGYRWRRN